MLTTRYKVRSGAMVIGLLGALTTTNAHAQTVYDSTAQSGSRYNPQAGGYAVLWDDLFTPLTGTQNQLDLSSVSVGIRRLVTSGALTDVGLNIYGAEMVWNSGTSTFGLGTVYNLYSTASLGAGAGSVTQSVSTGALTGKILNLETTHTAGMGAWFIGIEFTGANRSNTNNGWRVTTSDAVGSTPNGFFLSSTSSGPLTAATFNGGTYSRFMTTVNGTLQTGSSTTGGGGTTTGGGGVPEPGEWAAMGILGAGLTGLVLRKRRKG